jgi:membrane protein DedA with SNARE-associated domain
MRRHGLWRRCNLDQPAMDFDAITQAIVAFVKDNRQWAAPIVMLLAFCESMAFISLVLPFWTVLVLIGGLVTGTGSADFWVIAVSAAVGAALGDWVSYWLGYHYSNQIAGMWPLSKYPDLLPKGHTFFEKWGPWAILFGRFTGPLRASVPIVAGTVRMNQTTFQIANWGSALVWAISLLVFGDALAKVWTWARAYMAG